MQVKRIHEIDEVVAFIHRNLHEPMTLERLAAHVGYSPFHFSRMFKRQVGLPPLYYASALRLQKAKDLLIHTGLSIRDISLEIGQQSLGTFTTRFTNCVGVTPSEFRHSLPSSEAARASLSLLKHWRDPLLSINPDHAVEGTISTSAPFEGFILIGLFASPIPEGLPIKGTLLPGPGFFSLSGIQPGTYYLMATAISWASREHDMLLPYDTLRTRDHHPLIVHPHTRVPHQNVILHEPRLDDPPILISLPLLMNRFLKRLGQINHR